jgi:hypothetical protein
MVTWREFAAQTPELAAVGRELLLIDTPEMPGAGLGYLATVKRDGSPRVHPISPAIDDDHLYAFILRSSPKLGDLQGDPRFACTRGRDRSVRPGTTRSGMRRVVLRRSSTARPMKRLPGS